MSSGSSGSSRKPTLRSATWKKCNPQKTQRPYFRKNSTSFVTQRDLHGGKITPPPNPPDVNYQPWFHVTLATKCDAAAGTFELKTSDILALMRKQLDPTKRGFNQTTSGDGRFMIQFRIQSVRAWNLTGRVLSLSVMDFIESASAAGGRDQLCGIVDTGSVNHTPCVGFLLPATHRQHVIRTDDKQGNDVIVNIQFSSNDAVIMYLTLSFRFDGPSVPPKLLMPSDNILSGMDEISGTMKESRLRLDTIRRILSELKKISDNTYASRPSTIKKIVENVEVIAMAVAAVGTDGSEYDRLDDISQLISSLRVSPDIPSDV